MLPKDIKPAQKKVLSSYPVRNPVKWRMEDGKAVLIYSKNLTGVEKRIKKVLKGPDNIRRPLDKYGTDIWLMCDGEHSILDICKAMDEKYKEEMEPVLKRVGTFIEILLKLNLIFLQSAPDGGSAGKATGSGGKGKGAGKKGARAQKWSKKNTEDKD